MSEQTIADAIGPELAARTRKVAETEERTENEVVSAALDFYTSLDSSTHLLLAEISRRVGVADVADEFRRALGRLQFQYVVKNAPQELRERLVDMTEEEMDALAEEAVQETRAYHRRAGR